MDEIITPPTARSFPFLLLARPAQIVSNTVPRIPWISGFPILLYNFTVSRILPSLSFSRLLNNLPLGPRIDDSPPPGIRESTRIENLVLYTTTLVSKGRMVGKHEPFPAFQVAAQRRRT